MAKFTNEELEQKTEQWGSDRKITINGNIPTQTIKFGEEMAELFEANTKKDEKEFKDAIGDMVVVLSMVANLNKTSISHCQVCANGEMPIHKEFENATNVELLVINYGRLCSAVGRNQNEKLNVIIRDFIWILSPLAIEADSDINECWNLAYDEIKDRTGTLLENGNFVKDEN